VVGTVLFAALSPGAFLEIAEKGNGGEHTGEMQMLEASRNEVRKTVSEDKRGLSRLVQEIHVFFYCYVYEPIATGVRFLHLVIIFLPVISTVPVIWFGRRNPDRGGERSGTLWWFDFLVSSMERAGPAFIKVAQISRSFSSIAAY
jgi:aarF domain-containing kinase